MSKPLITLIVVCIILLILYFVYRKNFKIIKTPSVCLITGGVKTGKSLLSVNLAIKEYKRRYKNWWIKTKIFKSKCEKPLFYTNTLISFGNIKGKKKHKLDKNIRTIELAHLLREKRFNYGSVVYVCESSLMADNQDYKNERRNAELSLFNKLFGHSSKGGVLFYDTQCTLDNHYSIKRVLSTFFFIQKSVDFFLFRVLYVRELVNSDIANNNFNDDVDNTTRKVLVWRWYYKKYDRYYFSYLTDNLEHDSKKFESYNGGLISFNPLYRHLSLKDKDGGNNEKNIQK